MIIRRNLVFSNKNQFKYSANYKNIYIYILTIINENKY